MLHIILYLIFYSRIVITKQSLSAIIHNNLQDKHQANKMQAQHTM